jgi:hypothetical protein
VQRVRSAGNRVGFHGGHWPTCLPGEKFHVEWLPGYAPELNPEEQCNNGVKLALLNATRQSDDELRPLARQHVQRRAQAYPLTHCFAHAGLSVT